MWNNLNLLSHYFKIVQNGLKQLTLFYRMEPVLQNGTYKLSMTFSEKYPSEPPQVRFLSKMFHPNINDRGDICLDVLKMEKW